MSKDILNGMIGQYNRVSDYFKQFIETCPDKIWASKIGKFPVWQQVYHAEECVWFFLEPKDAPPKTSIYPIDVLLFKELPASSCGKPQLLQHAKEADAYAAQFFHSLQDADLVKSHEGFSTRIGAPFNNAAVITGLVGHMYYHFGQCDAALRDNGLEGLF